MTTAQEALQTIEIKDNICLDCAKCTVQYSINFDIKEKIKKIVRIKNIPADFLV